MAITGEKRGLGGPSFVFFVVPFQNLLLLRLLALDFLFGG